MPRMTPRTEPRKPEPAPETARPTPAAETEYLYRSKRACISIDSPDYFRRVYATVEERQVFFVGAPRAYYRMWGFESNALLFSRPAPILDYLDQHSPAPTFFDAPEPAGDTYDLRSVLVARARWWVDNKLPLNGSERLWVDQNLPDLVPAAARCLKEEVKA
jgi:hypothetical protein